MLLFHAMEQCASAGTSDRGGVLSSPCYVNDPLVYLYLNHCYLLIL